MRRTILKVLAAALVCLGTSLMSVAAEAGHPIRSVDEIGKMKPVSDTSGASSEGFETEIGVDWDDDASNENGNEIATLKEAIEKALGKEAAERINAFIDEATEKGARALDEAARKAIDALIDKNAPGPKSAAALKDLLDGVIKGTAKAADFKRASTELVCDVTDRAIDKSGLDEASKKAAKEAVTHLRESGTTKFTEDARNFIKAYVSDKLGEEAGNAAGNIFDAFTSKDGDVWEALKKDGPVIAEKVGAQLITKFEGKIAAQIDKYVSKHPALKELFSATGLDGSKLVNGVKNIWGIFAGDDGTLAQKLAQKFEELGKRLAEELQTIAVNVLKWGLQKFTAFLNNLANKALDQIIKWVGKLAGKTDNKLVKCALGWVCGQLESFKKKGTISTLTGKLSARVVNKVENKMKPQQSDGESNDYNGVFFGGVSGDGQQQKQPFPQK